MTTTCLDKETAAAYLSGHLDPGEAQACAAHLADCRACQQLVEEMSGMIDRVRQVLLGADGPTDERGIPPLAIIQARARALDDAGPWTHRLFLRASAAFKADDGKGKKSGGRESFARRWVVQGAWALAAVVVTVASLFYVMDRKVVSADEILRRAEEATVNSQTVPGRIVRRVWKESLINGYGPLPDGEYRREFWIDNVQNRKAYVRYDMDGNLREGNWWLADGTGYAYTAYSLDDLRLAIGPDDTAILEEINRLPQGIQEKVRDYYLHSRRPYYASASDQAAQAEREVQESLAGKRERSQAYEVILSSGRKAYRVTYHINVDQPDANIRQWDDSQLILDKTFSTVETQENGYRVDGLIYQRTRVLIDEQVFLPSGQGLRIFTPGPFPSNVKIRHVSPKTRVEMMEQHLHLMPPSPE